MYKLTVSSFDKLLYEAQYEKIREAFTKAMELLNKYYYSKEYNVDAFIFATEGHLDDHFCMATTNPNHPYFFENIFKC